MATIVKDFPPVVPPPEEERSDPVITDKVFLEEADEALARRLRAEEWDANDAAAAADLVTSNPNNNSNNKNNNNDASALALASTQTQTQTKPQTRSSSSVATLSNPWEFDTEQRNCSNHKCNDEFHPFNRRHHCRLCGKIFCNACSDQRALVPPSAIVLTPKGGKKAARPQNNNNNNINTNINTNNIISFSPDPDPDRMLTYIDEKKQLLYGKGLEQRFQLAREPLRVCLPCHEQLQPLQEELRTTNSNAMRFNHIDPTDPKRFLNSPLAFTLGHEVRKAAYTLNNMLPLPKRMGNSNFVDTTSNNFNDNDNDNFLTGDDRDIQQCKDECASITPNFSNLDGVQIPARLLEEAKGVAILTTAKGGFGVAGFEFGTGLVVARLGEQQQWSAPCAIGTAGLSWGALIGAQVSDHVFLLMTDAAVELMFNNSGNMQLGADIGVAVGPVGRALEADFAASPGAIAPIYTYSLSKGLYAGISLDGKVIVTRDRVNEKFYGRKVTGQQILNGEIPSPPAARPLYDALQRCHVYAKNDAGYGYGSSSRSSSSRGGGGGGGNGGGSSTILSNNRPPHLDPYWQDPYSQNYNNNNNSNTLMGQQQQQQQQQHQHQNLQQQMHPSHISPEGQQSQSQIQPQFNYGDPLMPPAANDQHSYAGQSYATGMSDITSDPGY